MTFDDDFARIIVKGSKRPILRRLLALGLEWPPPEKITLDGVAYQRTKMSAITDEERECMEYVCRGAQYEAVVTPGEKGL